MKSCEVGLCARFTWVWHSALGDKLSQQDTERPDIRFDGEAAIESCLRCGPFNGELGS